MDGIATLNVIEVERGCHTCQEEGCKADARWKLFGVYYCNRHWKEYLLTLQGGLNERT